jgi:hypothetical protein
VSMVDKFDVPSPPPGHCFSELPRLQARNV